MRFRCARSVFSSLSIAALALALSACGGGGGDDEPRVAEPLPRSPGEWTRFVPVATELDDRMYTPTCSGAPGTDPTYHFWAKRGSSNKLVVFFEGGGACWDGASCAFPIDPDAPPETPQLFKAQLSPGENPAGLGGIFDPDNPSNPVADWSFVYVPYCTGDIHSGSKTMSYVNPFTGQSYTIEHRGADNFRVIQKWIVANFPRPEQLLISGSSAGGYGAATHFSGMREAYPFAPAAMLADSAQGVVPPNFDMLRTESWNVQPPQAVFGSNPQSIPSSELVARLAQHYPADRFAQFTTIFDFGQIVFYDAMLNGLEGVQGTSCTQWSEQMLTELSARQQVDNFRSYVAAGTSHMVLPGNDPDSTGLALFYREASGGDSFTNWLSALLSPAGTGWANLGCTNCDTLPVPCPF